MKLRKAVELAKQARLEESHTSFGSEKNEPSITTELDRDAYSPPSAVDDIPVYNTSRRVEINRALAVENHCACLLPDSEVLDHYKILRTRMRQRAKEKGWRTIMITSARAGEGKTVTAINLALVFAKEFDQTVLLVDGSLHEQKIHRYLGYKSTTGLADYLRDNRSLADVISWPGIEKLSIISGGDPIKDSTELLASPRMTELVEEMKVRYANRYIFFDVPSLLDRADAIAFSQHVDCVLVVVRAGDTQCQEIEEAQALIPQEKLLGFVLNRA